MHSGTDKIGNGDKPTDKYTALRAAAEAVKETGHIARYTKAYVARQDFREVATHEIILDLLAERDAGQVEAEEAQRMADYWKNQCRGIVDHCKELQDQLAEREVELTGKPAEDYPDDFDLRNAADFNEDTLDFQTAQWLRELRRRRIAGTCLKIEGE